MMNAPSGGRGGVRIWLEVAVAGLAVGLGVLTLFTRDWIEWVFGVDPDNHSGSMEWLIVVGLFAVAACSAGAAGWEWRRSRLASGAAGP